jgi:multimeric flavodoxin WrbA
MSKLLIISGSPRVGNSNRVSKSLFEILQLRGDKVDIVELSKMNIEYCTGCLECEDEGICPIEDDMISVQEKMLYADVIIFSTPVYFDNLPGKLKSLVDRSNLFMSELKGKRSAAFLCGQADEESWKNCAEIIKNYSEICEMNFLGYVSEKARNLSDLDDTSVELITKKAISILG